MKNYELLTVLKPSLDSEELDKVVDKISEEIKSYKGSVSSVDKMGRKKLGCTRLQRRILHYNDSFCSC